MFNVQCVLIYFIGYLTVKKFNSNCMQVESAAVSIPLSQEACILQSVR